jgi:hypothetical protein
MKLPTSMKLDVMRDANRHEAATSQPYGPEPVRRSDILVPLQGAKHR